VRCPVCKSSLATCTSDGGDYHECRDGHGLLINGPALSPVLHAMAQHEATPHADVKELLVKRVERPADERRRCPNCWADMTTFNYAYNSNIFLDRCPNCDVVWIDVHERDRLMRYLQGHPKVDRLAEGIAAFHTERRDAELFEKTSPPEILETLVMETFRPDTPVLTKIMWAALALVFLALMILHACLRTS